MKKALYSAVISVFALTLILSGCARTIDTYDDPVFDNTGNGAIIGTDENGNAVRNDLSGLNPESGLYGNNNSGNGNANGDTGTAMDWNDTSENASAGNGTGNMSGSGSRG